MSRPVRVIRSFPHDPEAFTQGLVFHDGYLYESTGRWGQSSLRQVELETGRVLRMVGLPREHFGEGLALWRDRLIQLTWTSGTGFVYDLRTFAEAGRFSYEGEGWGLTHDGRHLLMSDGGDSLRRLDPETYTEAGRIPVMDQGVPLPRLNELEFVQGEVWANVFGQERIARIDPQSGAVLSWIDLAGLFDEHRRSSPTAVLNGIAFDPAAGRIFVTGKLWSKVYEIALAG
jgi:glutamine cyclotransferase